MPGRVWTVGFLLTVGGLVVLWSVLYSPPAQNEFHHLKWLFKTKRRITFHDVKMHKMQVSVSVRHFFWHRAMLICYILSTATPALQWPC